MFGLDKTDVENLVKPEDYIGRSAQQVREFLDGYIYPEIEKHKDELGVDIDLKV